jgi:hypothetical protein
MYSELWHTSVVSEATSFYKCHCYIQAAEVKKISNPFCFFLQYFLLGRRFTTEPLLQSENEQSSLMIK